MIRTTSLLTLTLLVCLALPARALIEFSLGNDPVQDRNWPAGALDLANLKCRVGFWVGPPVGGGQYNFLYRGDAKACQEAIDILAGIRAPKVLLVVHEGPHEVPFLKDRNDPRSDARVDWTFTVWDPRSFHRLYNDPKTTFMSRDTVGRFRGEVAPPQLDLNVAGPDGKGIDFKALRIPEGVTVLDRRATSAGYPAGAGSVARGAVYDLITSKPIPGAEVVLEARADKGPERIAAARVDEDGLFEIKGIPAGTYILSASAPGYVRRVIGYPQFGGNTLHEVTVHLAPPATLAGRVLDASGKPLAGLKVRAGKLLAIDGRGYATRAEPEATTDADGAFTFNDLPEGHCQLYIFQKGLYQLDSLKLHAVPARDVVVRMTGTGSVRGRVVGPDGKPAPGAQASINPVLPPGASRIGTWGGSTQVKPDGTFAFENVPPGRYTLSADPRAAAGEATADQKEVEVKPGQTAEVELTRPG